MKESNYKQDQRYHKEEEEERGEVVSLKTTNDTLLKKNRNEVLERGKSPSLEEDGDEEDGDDSKASGRFQSGSLDEDESGHTGIASEVVSVGKVDTARLFWIRVLMVSVLVISTVGVGVLVYLYTSSSETTTFNEQFEDNADKLRSGIGVSLALTLSAVDSFGIGILNYAESSKSPWPFVTRPNHAVPAAKMREQAKAFVTGFYPLVTEAKRDEWQNYSGVHAADWINKGIAVQTEDENFNGYKMESWQGWDVIHGTSGPSGSGPYLPTWQSYPVVSQWSPYNWDLLASPTLRRPVSRVIESNSVVMGLVQILIDPSDPETVADHQIDLEWAEGYIGNDEYAAEPIVAIYYPVREGSNTKVQLNDVDRASDDYPLVAVITNTMYWRDLLKEILPVGSNGYIAVIGNACNQSFTYRMDGPNTTYLGNSDLHDPTYDHQRKRTKFIDFEFFTQSSSYSGAPLDSDFCPYSLDIYPSADTENAFKTNSPILFTIVAVLIFIFTSIVFLVYDWQVEHRQRKVMHTAEQTSRIVSSLFPSTVRERLYTTTPKKAHIKEPKKLHTRKHQNFWLPSDNTEEVHQESDRPIADLFPEATVFFADIKGFTAWASMRQPEDVFVLLESVYGAFDKTARRRGVFKIETIGDSYVAVCGLPDPNKDHAVVMARFATECHGKMAEVVRSLEATMGPDTVDLTLRIGLHSGPVTAGVLRGERARFQLFGDTVNTASRMESTGVSNRTQVSQATATLLANAGKSHWVESREDLVEAKGKGALQTFWVNTKASSSTEGSAISAHDDRSNMMASAPVENALWEKDYINVNNVIVEQETKDTTRLVKWNTDVLATLLCKVITHRTAHSNKNRQQSSNGSVLRREARSRHTDGKVVETIVFPHSEESKMYQTGGGDDDTPQDEEEITTLNPIVHAQLERYVGLIASLYNSKNIFHSFDHASHVAMSMVKLVAQISLNGSDNTNGGHANLDYRDRITDPLTQFAAVFTALIHDVDHPGVSNQQLIQEKSSLAAAYNNKSVAEHNSLDIAWKLLSEDGRKAGLLIEGSDDSDEGGFAVLRRAICGGDSQQDALHFRQLLVNCVMATDVFDKDAKELRCARWERAFGEESTSESTDSRATLVLEHLIQASDVAHTMQHWAIYRKWNQRYFAECYSAYISGRSTSNPADGWYKGELIFFDSYVIPLAQKLTNAGVFGGHSATNTSEYLNYAISNRNEWCHKGVELVELMVRDCQDAATVTVFKNTKYNKTVNK